MPVDTPIQGTIAVSLRPEPEMRTDLESIIERVSCGLYRDVVLDLSSVDIVTSSSLSRLLQLRKLLTDRGHRLVLCGLAANTKGIFAVTTLDKTFEFADDTSAALTHVEPVHREV